MCKSDAVIAAIGISILFVVVVSILLSGVGSLTLDSEKTFDSRVHNSLWHIGEAKQRWAEEKNKSQLDSPSLAELIPYLGDQGDAIEKLTKLGIKYRITSMAEPQSDVATLARDFHFRGGVYHFYPEGTSYCIHGGWVYPRSITSKARFLYYNSLSLFVTLAVVLCILAMGIWRVFCDAEKASPR